MNTREEAATRPQLEDGPWKGSFRIQSLDGPAQVEWMRVEAIQEKAGNLEISLGSIDQVPKRTARLKGTELLGPFSRVRSSVLSPQLWRSFVPPAAHALLETRIPIRVLLEGRDATRPRTLGLLAGEVPSRSGERGVRLRLDPSPRSLVDHLAKHLDERSFDAEDWRRAQLSALGLPFGLDQMKGAARYARRERVGQELGRLDGLAGADWPAVECYVAIAARAFERALDGLCLHVARERLSAAPSAGPLERVLDLAAPSNLRPDQEQFVVLHEDLLSVARGDAGLDRPLRWRTSFGTGKGLGEGKLGSFARTLRGRRGFAVASWPDDLVRTVRSPASLEPTASVKDLE